LIERNQMPLVGRFRKKEYKKSGPLGEIRGKMSDIETFYEE